MARARRLDPASPVYVTRGFDWPDQFHDFEAVL